MKKTELREKIAEHIFNVIMSCSDATVEEAEKMAHNETMPILSIVREAVSAVKPKERTEGILGILGTTHRDGVLNEGFNKGVSDYHYAIMEKFR